MREVVVTNLVFDRSTSEAGTNKSWLGDHPLPRLLLCLLTRLDDAEHLDWYKVSACRPFV